MLGEKPMLQWVWDAATKSELFDEVAFAIDAHETAHLIDSFGGKYFMTSPDCLSGTDRLIELQQRGDLKGDIWVNFQGDEPFIHREMMEDLLCIVKRKTSDIYSLKKRIYSRVMVDDPHIVKVVTDAKERALYFSRSPIPYYREICDFDRMAYYKHIGIYAFTQAALSKIATLSPTCLEHVEQLEQLRFLEYGLSIQLHNTEHDSFSIDLPRDLTRALERIYNHTS